MQSLPAPDAQRQLDAILNNASVAIFMMDAHYECVYMNPAAVRLSGYTLAEMRGRLLHDVVHHTYPDGTAFPIGDCPIGRSLESHDHAVGEEVFVHKDGTFYPVAFTAAPMRADDGTLLGTVLEVRDIRQEKAALAAAREADRAKDDFLAVLGHELRNPLAPISTSLHLLRLQGAPARELAVIERQVGHLSRLVDDLLDVSRAARGLLELRLARTDVGEVVAHGLDVVRPMLARRQQPLHVDAAEGLLVDADEARLSQVLANLLVNASKFSPAGAPVRVRAWREGEQVLLAVRDEGEGIAPDMLERVFSPFVQAPQARDRARGGLGLGLAISRTIVQLHGGEIRARSAGPGAGSEFVVVLPAAAHAPAAAPDAPAHVPAAPQAPRRVLLVDDNRDAADVHKTLLELHGHEVLAAYDPDEALRQAQAFAPEVALLDVGLPGMDGYELAARLREVLGARTPTLLALTGYGEARDRQRSREAGFAGHLVKPVDPPALLRAIEAGPGAEGA